MLVCVCPVAKKDGGSIVERFVRLSTFPVLDAILDGSDDDDEDEGQEGKEGRKATKDRGDGESGNEQEIQIGNATELLKQVFGYEREQIIFLDGDHEKEKKSVNLVEWAMVVQSEGHLSVAAGTA